jgi:hypothetical protein
MIDDGYTLPGFEHRCTVVRDTLEQALAARNMRAADFYVLPTGTSWIAGVDPAVTVSVPAHVSGSTPDASSIQKLAQKCIQWIPLQRGAFDSGAAVAPLSDLSSWMQSVRESVRGREAQIHIMHAVEQNMYARAASLGTGEFEHVDVQQIERLVERCANCCFV